MRPYLNDFFAEFDYPQEAKKCLLAAYDCLKACPAFAKPLADYENDMPIQHRQMLSDLAIATDGTGVHPFTAQLLIYLCMSRRTLDRYEKEGISRQIWHDSMSDMKWKLMECYKMYGIWGSFVAGWFGRFFELTRFALGRLQFETIVCEKEVVWSGGTIEKGQTVINVHIPSGRPLEKEACTASFCRAVSFYEPMLGKVRFICHSWLLNPDMRLFLPETSHVLAFNRRFEIAQVEADESFHDCWRLFGRVYDQHPETLPQLTGFQRAYAQWLAKGHTAKCALGVLKEY